MIIYRPDQSLFESEAQVITNTVNCVGVMGKGIALEFKNRYPKMFNDYKRRCEQKELKPGQPYIWENEGRMILNFPSKDHWRGNSRMEWVENGLRWIRDNYENYGISTIAIPPVGCGNGGLYWSDVKILVEKYFADLEYLLVMVYLPRMASSGTKKESSTRKRATSRRSAVTAASEFEGS